MPSAADVFGSLRDLPHRQALRATSPPSPHTSLQPLIPDNPHGLTRRRKSARAMFRRLFCCGGRSSSTSRPRRERTRRRHRRRHAATPSRASTFRHDSSGVGRAGSVASENEYHDAREAFSLGESDASPLSSAQVSPRAGSISQYQDDGYHDMHSIGEGGSCSGSESGSSATSQHSAGFGARIVSCLAIMRASSIGEGPEPEGHRTPGTHARAGGHVRLPAGCTFQRRPPADGPDVAACCWDECEATTYQVRSKDYMRTKLKQPSSKAIYRLAAIDLFQTEAKAYHVAKTFALPPTGPPVVCKAVGGGPEVALPPLLVMNVQLPDYPAGFWGANDGPGQSIVYYFTLREDFDPDRFENTAALGLLQRFVSNGREVDGSPTRDRLKMIARVSNLDEWARVAPLNSTEYKLLLNYNDKPVLTRPQQMFYVGQNYLEVDLDVHSYAFLARKALWSYHDRLATVVWENAFVIQGNSPDELPEQLLGCGRIYRTDFRQCRFLSEISSSSSAVHSPPPATPAGQLLQDGAAASAEPGQGTAAGGGGSSGSSGAAASSGAVAAVKGGSSAAAAAARGGAGARAAADAAVLVGNGSPAGGEAEDEAAAPCCEGGAAGVPPGATPRQPPAPLMPAGDAAASGSAPAAAGASGAGGGAATAGSVREESTAAVPNRSSGSSSAAAAATLVKA